MPAYEAHMYPIHTQERLRKLHVSIFMFDFLVLYAVLLDALSVCMCVQCACMCGYHLTVAYCLANGVYYITIRTFHYRFLCIFVYWVTWCARIDEETSYNNESIIWAKYTACAFYWFFYVRLFIYLIIIIVDCVFNLPYKTFTILFTCFFGNFWLKKLNQSINRLNFDHRPILCSTIVHSKDISSHKYTYPS